MGASVSLDSMVPINGPSTWAAGLSMQFDSVSVHGQDKTVLKGLQHSGPLYVQKCFYPEGPAVAHVYPLHPPGGLVSGDELALGMQLSEQAKVLMTTPGAGRVYRARPDRTLQIQRTLYHLASGAQLEVLPQETIVYPDAQALLTSDVHLEQGSAIAIWDIVSFGLPAQAAHFTTGVCTQQFQIWQGGRLKLRERLVFDSHKVSLVQSAVGFQGCAVCGLLVMGPFPSQMRGQPTSQQADLYSVLQATCEQYPRSAITWHGSFLIVRMLADCSSAIKPLFQTLWAITRPLLMGREACPPRIWRT